VPSTTPQQSTRGFVAPSSAPIKKTPDIGDIIGEREKGEKEQGEGTKARMGESTKEEDRMEVDEKSPSNFEGVSGEAGRGSLYENKPTEAKPQPNEGIAGQARNDGEKFLLLSEEKVADGGSPPDDGRGDNDFPTHWHTMFNHIFHSVPTIYIPLKETLPKIENNIIKVTVKNEVQKEHFEAKIRDVLEFLRTHFNEQIEEIIVEANEQLETKKIIYDVKDKLQNFKEQNAEFEDFLQILDLKIKD